MCLRSFLRLIAMSAVLTSPAISRAGIVTIGPFAGTNSENFDNTSVDGAKQVLDVLGGLATIRNLTSGGALKVERSSSLDGDLVVRRSAPWMVGQLGIAEWTFSRPVSDFGGYFENNSRFDDANVDFYDKSGALLGSRSATVPKDAQTWTWNGWHSDTPTAKLVITGNDAVFLHGFIWYDDFEMNVAAAGVPEPTSWALVASAAVFSAPWVFRRVMKARVIRPAGPPAWRTGAGQ
jgi:hypothetical protein